MAQEVQSSEPVYAVPVKNTAYPWYIPTIDKYLVPKTRQLLETYSNVPLAEQSRHVHTIRDKAWSIRTYPCTGLGVWLVPFVSFSPDYPSILKRLQSGDVLMDVGCFLGGDLRQLVFDGAPSENMYAVDIVSHWELGYELFRDRSHFNAKFIEGDILSTSNPGLQSLEGRIDIISISAVLHQWSWEGQVEAAKRLVCFCKPGSLVIGHQIGNAKAKQVLNQSLQVQQWRHDPASFERLWNQVGIETGSNWETRAWLRDWEYFGWDPKDMAWLEPHDMVLDFAVTRIE